jgi:hypothetical protein
LSLPLLNVTNNQVDIHQIPLALIKIFVHFPDAECCGIGIILNLVDQLLSQSLLMDQKVNISGKVLQSLLKLFVELCLAFKILSVGGAKLKFSASFTTHSWLFDKLFLFLLDIKFLVSGLLELSVKIIRVHGFLEKVFG